jgi:hypothetical protein
MTRISIIAGATSCLDPALRLEAKLAQPVHAYGQVGNLMFRVSPQCGDRLLNPVGWDGGAPEKRPEAILRRDAKVAIAGRAEHDVVGRGSYAPDPKTTQTGRGRRGPRFLREGRRHRAATLTGRSHVQIQDPDK